MKLYVPRCSTLKIPCGNYACQLPFLAHLKTVIFKIQTSYGGLKVSEFNHKLDRMVDRVKPWFMVNGLAHGL